MTFKIENFFNLILNFNTVPGKRPLKDDGKSGKKRAGNEKRANLDIRDIQGIGDIQDLDDLDRLIERMSAENKALEKILKEIKKKIENNLTKFNKNP